MSRTIPYTSTLPATPVTGRDGQLRRVAVVLTSLVLACVASAPAKVFLTVEDGLKLAFPGCAIEKRTVFLTESQMASAAALAGMEIESPVIHPYEAICDDSASNGFAFLDTHRVRTLAETLMIAIDVEGHVRRIEILAFREPEEYIPRTIWYDQFTDRPLSPELRLKREIRGVTGATLTAHATTDAVRRVLALYETLYGDKGTAASDVVGSEGGK